MAAQKGKDLHLKIDPTGAGSFTTVAGLRTRSLAFNSESVDITSQESAGQWRELLDGAGVRHAKITGQGVFKDAASDEMLRAAFFAGSIDSYQMAIPAFGIVQGPFQIVALELTGRHDNEIAFDISLESAGQLAFTATP